MSGTGANPEHAALRARYLAERDKRLRKDGETQYRDAAGEFEEFARDPYAEPIDRPARDEWVEVAVIGGGFGGLLTAAKLRDAGIDDFRIIEQGGDFGGTWYWNRYPGVRCDIESYCYMPLLEEVGTMPKERYSTGAEIFAHCQAIGRHYRLYENALFQTKVTRIAWNDSEGRWNIETDRGDTIRARFVTVSQGPLAKVKLPGIPGIKDYKGRIFHSARWDYDYTGGDQHGGLTGLAGKRVAVIGTGATSVQIVPRLAEHAKQLHVFQRTPSAIDVRNNSETDADWYRAQPKGWQRARMDNFLANITMAPNDGDVVADQWTDFWKRFAAGMKARKPDEDPHDVMQVVDYAKMGEIRARVDAIVTDPAIAERVKPWYNYLCKRPLYSDEFLQAFNRPNVELIDTDGRGIERITETGLVVDGKEYPVDLIVFATGFDVGAAAHKVGGYELIGRNGLTLDARWAKGVRSVHGTQVSGFPNFHIVGGTAQGTTAFNFTHTLAMQAEHAVALIGECTKRGVRTLEVTHEAERKWAAEMDAKYIDRTHFYEDCTPGFLNNEGNFREKPTFISATYGAGPIAYEAVIAEWRRSGVDADTVVTYRDDARARDAA
ncbi:NAD(P)/FAD-dependent oxidoreductase [Sphingomonas sp. AOB5]|uniref:flavin-containing monooxygenase n=1 Tax=Sphingomonas sp. AOB5 TaxID=3034017 RepID=UPI0023F95220|nr:NAD(P)/FAD-dependent oxidoreductase [Sphingomonas sp. AOB5]MDF7777159.1 NAD(P)/FAD-dependent oxidoreductase [Sphingomonas sp. AOB5]